MALAAGGGIKSLKSCETGVSPLSAIRNGGEGRGEMVLFAKIGGQYQDAPGRTAGTITTADVDFGARIPT